MAGPVHRARRTAGTIALVVAALAIVLPTTASPAAADEPSPWEGAVGVNTHQFWLDESKATAAFDVLTDAGIDRTRESFVWGQMEPTDDAWNWYYTDGVMAAAANEDMDVLAVVSGYKGGQSGPPTTTAQRNEYAELVTQVVNRYEPGGTYWTTCANGTNPTGICPDTANDTQPLRAIEIWNEPWLTTHWATPDAGDYAALVRAGAAAAHTANASVLVGMSGDERMTHNAQVWFHDLVRESPSLEGDVDFISLHPYNEWGPTSPAFGPTVIPSGSDPRYSFLGKVQDTIDEMDGQSWDLPIWITEMGWATDAEPGADHATLAEQAQWLHEAIVLAFRSDAWEGRIERFYVYQADCDHMVGPTLLVCSSADDPAGPPTSGEAYFGIIDSGGNPKPAFDAVEWLTSAPGDHAFVDVRAGHQYDDEITWMSREGLTNGYDDGTFRGTSTITRQATAAMYYRLAGSPAFSPGAPDFPDVSASHPFFKEIEWVANQGIMNPYGDGKFKPANSVSRQAAIAYIYQYEGSPSFSTAANVFSDVSAGHPFEEAIEWAANEGIAAGTPNPPGLPVFSSTANVSRQAQAAFMYRAFS
jgi:hypothetical protein